LTIMEAVRLNRCLTHFWRNQIHLIQCLDNSESSLASYRMIQTYWVHLRITNNSGSKSRIEWPAALRTWRPSKSTWIPSKTCSLTINKRKNEIKSMRHCFPVSKLGYKSSKPSLLRCNANNRCIMKWSPQGECQASRAMTQNAQATPSSNKL